MDTFSDKTNEDVYLFLVTTFAKHSEEVLSSIQTKPELDDKTSLEVNIQLKENM